MAKAKDAYAALRAQLSSALGGAPGKFSAVAPEAGMYGVMQPAYAAAVQGHTDFEKGAGGAALSTVALGMGAENEAKRYEAQLEATRRAQAAGIERQGYYDLSGKLIDKQPEGALHGQYQIGRVGEGYGVLQDIPLQATANDLLINAADADARLKNSSAVLNAGRAGHEISSGDYSQLFRGTTESPIMRDAQGNPVLDENGQPRANPDLITFKPGMIPTDEIDRRGTRSFEEELQLIEAKEKYKAQYGTDPDEDGVEWSMDVNPYTGKQFWKAKGSRAALQAEGAGPPGYLNPKAGAQDRGASATPAVGNAMEVAKSLFPGIQITDWKRDPNSALGKKNPDSFHVKTAGAIDSRAIPGMTFQQYVQKYKDAGYPVLEAIDEYKNPSKHATGGHWHVALGNKQQPTRNAAQVTTKQGTTTRVARADIIIRRATEKGAKVQHTADGFVIQAPNGQVASYDNAGNRTS